MKIAIIGGGPAGLRAAEVGAAGGASVTVFDARPSVGRKFLVAGKGGLNLTKGEPRAEFIRNYLAPEADPLLWPSLIDEFDPDALRAWAAGLGIETFAASTGRVYPREMKAAPLLRRWVLRLRELGVRFAMGNRWIGLQPGSPHKVEFLVDGQVRREEADAVVLALGGASWPGTGSDGAWVKIVAGLGINVAPLLPANCGWEVAWPVPVLTAAEGQPLKNVLVSAGGVEIFGELLVTHYGLEGGALYQLGPSLRAMPAPEITIDFRPSLSVEQLVAKMGPIQRNFLPEARQRWKLSDAAFAILSHDPAAAVAASTQALALTLKHCQLPLIRPRPIAEAISSAGGVCWGELEPSLMLRKLPGVFVAGEMIDWEAPTGGYLIQGCFATGTRAGHGALEWACSHGKASLIAPVERISF